MGLAPNIGYAAALAPHGCKRTLMSARIIFVLSLLYATSVWAGDLPARPYTSIDDAVAAFVGARYKMKLIIPLGEASSLRPGDVLVSKRIESELPFWDLDEERSCQSTNPSTPSGSQSPVLQSHYELSGPFDHASKLLGFSVRLSVSLSRIEVWTDQNFILVADDDDKSSRTAAALANCKNVDPRGSNRYLINSLRRGRLHLTLQFADQSSARAAKEVFDGGDSDFVVEHSEERSIQVQTREAFIFGVSVRPLPYR